MLDRLGAQRLPQHPPTEAETPQEQHLRGVGVPVVVVEHLDGIVRRRAAPLADVHVVSEIPGE